MRKQDLAIHYIQQNNLTGIKAGTQRNTFLNIWMVVVENRIFARSWGKAEKSWYHTFLQEPIGQIQCGDAIYDISALAIPKEDEMQLKINEAYLKKYNHGENAYYAKGIIEPSYWEKTMEFVVKQ